MTPQINPQAGVSIKEGTVEATVIRKDGTVEHLGVIARLGAPQEPVQSRYSRHRKKRNHPSRTAKAILGMVGGHSLLILLAIYLSLAMISTLTNAGRAIVTNKLKGAGTEPNHIGWGTGTGGTAASTALVAAAAEARTAGTSTQVTTTVTNDTYQVVGTITVTGAGKTISEVGLFDATTGGNLFVYADFTGIALAIGDSIAFTIKLQFT